MQLSKAHFKKTFLMFTIAHVILSCLEWYRQGLNNQNLPKVNQITVFLKMFGDIISSKIVRLAFWHWTLEHGLLDWMSSCLPSDIFKDLNFYSILLHITWFMEIFFGTLKFFYFVWNFFRILLNLFFFNFLELFSIQKFSKISKSYSGTLVPA